MTQGGQVWKGLLSKQVLTAGYLHCANDGGYVTYWSQAFDVPGVKGFIFFNLQTH